MRTIFEYKDYRRFLEDIYLEQKSSSQLTLAKFAKKIGISSSLLKMVMDGQRKLGGEKIHMVAGLLNLSEGEWDFFESLVRLNDADTDEEKKFYQKRLEVIKEENPLTRIRTDRSEILRSWYLPAILIYLIDFSKVENGELTYDLDLLSRKLGLAKIEIQELIDSLKSTGLLTLKEEGKVQIVFEKILGNFKKKQYLDQVVTELKKQLSGGFDKPDRIFLASALSMEKSQIEEFKQEFKLLVDKYSVSEIEKDGHVVQTVFGLFPII